MTPPNAVVIGVGNRYRRDDAVGPTVIELLADRKPPGVRLVACDADPITLLECWSDVELAVVVDAVQWQPSAPGLIHRADLHRPPSAATFSTHGLGVLDALGLARALDRAPSQLVAYLVEVADTGFGQKLSPSVRDALPRVVQAVLSELARPHVR